MSNNTFFSFFGDRFVINLDSEKKRLQSFYETMNAYDILNVNRFPAVSHAIGVKGCGLSHLNIIKEAKKKGLDSVFVFEDDLEFVDFDASILNSIIPYLTNNQWGFLRMSYTYHGELQHLEKARELGRVCRRHPNLVEFKKDPRHSLCNQAASAYHSSVFDKIINEFDPETCSTNDIWLSAKLNSLCISPQMAIQNMPPGKRKFHLNKKQMVDNFLSSL